MRIVAALLLWVALPNVAGLLGSIPTAANMEWYQALAKPALTPPGWVFGPVWTALNILMGVAAFLVWRSVATRPEAAPEERLAARRALAVFVAHLALYVLWSVLFFGLRAPGWALAEIAVFWLAVAWLVVAFWRIDVRAGLLMVPYLAWVSFAGYLNYRLMALN
jgi:tryptophan-rich sensory protein